MIIKFENYLNENIFIKNKYKKLYDKLYDYIENGRIRMIPNIYSNLYRFKIEKNAVSVEDDPFGEEGGRKITVEVSIKKQVDMDILRLYEYILAIDGNEVDMPSYYVKKLYDLLDDREEENREEEERKKEELEIKRQKEREDKIRNIEEIL